MSKIKVGVIGASGFVGAELTGILLKHPEVEISGLSSINHVGKAISELYPAFTAQYDQKFEENDTVINRSDILFICLPHGESENLVKQCMDQNKKVVDVGADFRLKNLDVYKGWYGVDVEFPALHEQAVYGLPEMNREEIKRTKLVANPGCYSTSILLGLYPVISKKLVDPGSLIIDAKSGVTGAGKTLSEGTNFAVKNEGFNAYKVATHRHTPEIEEKLNLMGAGEIKVSFVPHLLPVNRGILSTMYVDILDGVDAKSIQPTYENWYEDEPFVTVLKAGKLPDISHVQHSNHCQIGLTIDERTNRLIIVSVIDNMQKGAAGQAVQNFNLMLGIDETKGLSMVAPSF
ncbi:N-acetyl-gamma-glutamyl-phosphate reductase [Marinilactibacillus piezotolerans]|uniref:N-acetyl-gamma-glutamyl-phosphate reductase n=1 Tax=Marinilactibacillus piezotolerans TaxID=258723 RepID=A0A1I3VV14_9LACT|nr:N-acetyl-gamma-glutamyl-phosphate reductase [Marinilactibacillus piezotolerans]SFJ98989.1 N-acetyl-gamma-glutamyl-phosphate reductase [Marinilactibacillus piezotolerans]